MKNILLISILFTLLGCQNIEPTWIVDEIAIIPAPQQITTGNGYFEIPQKIRIQAPAIFDNETHLLGSYLERIATVEYLKGSTLDIPNIIFEIDNTIKEEGYVLGVLATKIFIKAKSSRGAFYAVQSLIQLLPPALEEQSNKWLGIIKIPVHTIKDAPAFPYRGMHLDVSRHFFSKEFVKKYITYLASLKMNTFHWHLTDDQGWRIEIKQYPDLTSKGAYREETLIGHYNKSPQEFDAKRYGGFYTQEDVKEIVAFAKEHHVTVIPEIELPGHAQAAIHAYPELGCTGENVPVATKWGVFKDIYCPKPETFTFLKNVLDEVMELFPGEYIHIGGDEAPKTAWKKCAHCQALIKEKGLEDEHGLQSYFIKEIEMHINSKGKKIIGWDEILEGGLAPNATVMFWRGTEGAVAAANQGHDVILTPTSHAYFDYYQATYEEEPTAIGGYLPLKKVYAFNPIPKDLQGTGASKHVLGAQGNIWTEYMATPGQVEYMAFPRMLAMSEVVWKGPTTNLDKEYSDFLSRLEPYLERLDAKEINYANHLFDLEGRVVKKEGEVFYELMTPTAEKQIKYSINDGVEQTYLSPFIISRDANIKGQVYNNGESVGRSFSNTIKYHNAIKAKVSVNVAPHPAYGAGGVEALINGVSGSNTRFGDKEWLGFWGDDLEITITFPVPTKVSKISTRFYNANGQWLYAPKEIEIETDYGVLPKVELPITDQTILDVNLGVALTTSFIKISIPSYGIIPDGLQGAGNKAWTFIDEIIVE
ncbi:MAG: hexosaminidase [Candidatus Paceibacteria bacterium]|jgi:hexosaminidase